MSGPALPGIERILFTEEQIDARIREVASEISRAYEGRALKLIGLAKIEYARNYGSDKHRHDGMAVEAAA